MAKSRKQRKKRIQRPLANTNQVSGRVEGGAVPHAQPVTVGGWALPYWLREGARERLLLAGGVLLLMVGLCLWPVLVADFVWDDKAFLEAPPVAQLLGVVDIWFNPKSLPFEAHYWPMLYSSFWLEHRLWGFNPTGMHGTNLLLHGLNTLLVWRLLARMGVPGAWLIAAIFAVHPVRVEPVAWVMSRKDLLGTFFYLLAVSYWLHFRKNGKAGAYWAMLGLFAASMFSKTMAITLPAVLLVWAWWQNGRIVQRDLLHVTPIFLLGLAITAGDLSFYTGRAEINFEFSFVERVIIASKALWFYFGKLLWPHPLPVIYPHWDINPANLLNWLYLLAALALTAGLWLARHRLGRGPLAGALFFAITLSPTLGFGNNSYMEYSFAADRYQYLASVGLVAVLVGAAVVLCRKHLVGKLGGAALVAALLAGYGALSWQQAWVFENEIALFSHATKLNPKAHSGHYNLGIALTEEGRLEEAEAAFKKELARDSSEANYLQGISHLASLHFEAGRYQKSLALYEFCISINSTDAELHQNFGSALAQLGRYEQALKSFDQALAIDPTLELARVNRQLAIKLINENKAKQQ